MRNYVYSRAHRTLRRMASYTNLFQEIPADKAYVKEVSLAERDQYIGVYEDFPGETRDAIVITNHGLHIFRDEIIYVPFVPCD